MDILKTVNEQRMMNIKCVRATRVNSTPRAKLTLRIYNVAHIVFLWGHGGKHVEKLVKGGFDNKKNNMSFLGRGSVDENSRERKEGEREEEKFFERDRKV